MVRSARGFFLALAALPLSVPATAQPAAAPLTVVDLSGQTTPVSLAELEALPSSSVTLAGEHGDSLHLTGPTVWTVLDHAHAIDPNFHKRVRQTLTAAGRDGYTVILAMGEIDPEFENKSVLLAIDPERHSLRLAIPGDKRLGRDVRDVVSLTVR